MGKTISTKYSGLLLLFFWLLKMIIFFHFGPNIYHLVTIETIDSPEIDLVFALSAVASQADETFEKIKTAVNEVIYTFGTKKLRYAVLVYGSTPTTEARFTDSFPDVKSIKQAISNLPRKSGGPAIDRAMVEVRRLFANARPSSHKVVVIVTDKRSSSSDRDMRSAAQDLEGDGVKIIAVGIGNEADVPRLDKLSPKPRDTIASPKNKDPKKLGQEIVQTILNGECKAVSKRPKGITTNCN